MSKCSLELLLPEAKVSVRQKASVRQSTKGSTTKQILETIFS